MKKILKMIGFLALYVLAYLAASFFIGIVFGIILVLSYFLNNRGASDPNSMINLMTEDMLKYTALLVIITSILAFVLLFVIHLIRKKPLLASLGFKRISLKNSVILIFTSIGLYFFIASMLSYVIKLAPMQRFVPGYEKVMESLMSGNLIVTVIAVGVVGPIFEEIFFRGAIFNELRGNIPIVPAVIIQALFFGIFHGNVLQGSYAFIIGIIFALAYIWTKSLWASIMLHFIYNNIGLAMDRITGDNLPDSLLPILALAGLIISSLAVYALWRNRMRNQSQDLIPLNNRAFTAEDSGK